MYLPELRPEVSQGDIFIDVPVPYLSNPDDLQDLKPRSKNISAMLINHGCDYDKRNNRFALLAEVHLLTAVEGGSRGNIQKNITINAFYLPPSGETLQESYVDFRHIVAIPKQIIESLSQSDKRALSITDDALRDLWVRLAYYFGPRENDINPN